MTRELLWACCCGEAETTADQLHGIEIRRCTRCGMVRQAVRMTEAEVGTWYQQRYFAGTYQHTYAHDRAVAALRCEAYQVPALARLLDVGCGNGAFVDECRQRGISAVGQDLAQQSDGPFVFVGALADVAFPTERFDWVTMHDVLEHWVQPRAALDEIARVMRPGGTLVVDYPRFWHESGVHHWKPVEHLWMWTEEEITREITRAGFTVQRVAHPIPSKVVVYATRNPVTRVQIVVPPGIGDTYWVMTKLPGFMQAHRITTPPAVWVQDTGPRRTHPFLETLPLVHAAGYREVSREWRRLLKEAYETNGRTVFPRALGVDYFMAYNGVVGAGRALSAVDPQWGTAWYPKMHIAKRTQATTRAMQQAGPYCVVYLVGQGMYTRWVRAVGGVSGLQEIVRAIQHATGYRMVFVGASWDAQDVGVQVAAGDAGWENLIGTTSYEELVGVLRGAQVIFGWPSGATLLGPVLRVPTVLGWHPHFARGMWTGVVPPDARYAALDTVGLTAEQVLAAIHQVTTLVTEEGTDAGTTGSRDRG